MTKFLKDLRKHSSTILKILCLIVLTISYLYGEEIHISLWRLTINPFQSLWSLNLYSKLVIFLSLFFLYKNFETIFFYFKLFLSKYYILLTILLLLGLPIIKPVIYNKWSILLGVFFIICIIFLIKNLIRNYISQPKGVEQKIEVEEEKLNERTVKTIFDLVQALENKDIKTINLHGGWGSGKSHVIRRFFNLLSTSDSLREQDPLIEERKKINSIKENYIPLFIELDKIDSTENIISRFENLLKGSIQRFSGINLQFDIEAFLLQFYDIPGLKNILSIIKNILGDEQNLKELFETEKCFRNKEFLIIIDDLDRVLRIEELKFILEFLSYLRNQDLPFKIIFVSNNDQLEEILQEEVINEKDETLRKVKVRGYLDKYRDTTIQIPPLTNHELQDIFFRNLVENNRISQDIVQRASNYFGQNILPFDSDFRLMKRLNFFIENLNIERINIKQVDFIDVILLGLEMIKTPELKRYLNDRNTYLRYNPDNQTLQIFNEEHGKTTSNYFKDNINRGKVASEEDHSFKYQMSYDQYIFLFERKHVI
jgi:hypothetical protein